MTTNHVKVDHDIKTYYTEGDLKMLNSYWYLCDILYWQVFITCNNMFVFLLYIVSYKIDKKKILTSFEEVGNIETKKLQSQLTDRKIRSRLHYYFYTYIYWTDSLNRGWMFGLHKATKLRILPKAKSTLKFHRTWIWP